jgi:hypothetical protein
MTPVSPIDPGSVEWSGENPGIYLKEAPDGPWTALAVFFRVVLSPHGRGHAVVLLGEPGAAKGHPAASNLCIADNEALARYLVADFVSNFATFRGKAGLGAMTYLPLKAARTTGDPRSNYSEIVEAEGVRVEMAWRGLGRTFAASVPPAMSATGRHHMYSVFVEGREGSLIVNGRALPGRPIERDFLGSRLSSAFLAFSETWVRA